MVYSQQYLSRSRCDAVSHTHVAPTGQMVAVPMKQKKDHGPQSMSSKGGWYLHDEARLLLKNGVGWLVSGPNAELSVLRMSW